MSTPPFTIRPILPTDDAAVAAIIRTVMPEFGANGPGFAIHDPEVDWMSRAYSGPRSAYFVVEQEVNVYPMVAPGKALHDMMRRPVNEHAVMGK